MSDDVFAVQDLCKNYGAREAVRDVTVRASAGEFIGFVGANGSGKTTFLKCLSGQLRPTSGSIEICGIDLLREPVKAKTRIGWAIEAEALPKKLTGNQALEFVAGTKERGNWSDELAPLSEMLEMQWRLDDPIDSYSQGMRAKLGALAALIGEPRLVIFDETLATFDPVAAFRLKQYLYEGVSEKRWCVLLSTHAIESVEHIATRVLMMQDGKLAADWSREELTDLKNATGKTLEQIIVEKILRRGT
jgi:ABC-2 type transport system ATP-binding protein